MKKILAYILLLSLVITACKKPKNEQNDNDENTPKGTLMFHLHTYLDENEVDLYNAIYTNDDGRSISLSVAQLYVSEIELVKLDGSSYVIPNNKIFKILDQETFLAGEVPVGNYKGIKFKVGVNSNINSNMPSAMVDSNIFKHTEMWMSNTVQPDGYAFLNVQGTIDTTSDLSGTMVPFTYKIGSNANLKQVTMPEKNFSIIENQAEYAHIKINYNKLFHGVQLNNINNLSVLTVGDNSGAAAQKIVSNIPSMFIYE